MLACVEGCVNGCGTPPFTACTCVCPQEEAERYKQQAQADVQAALVGGVPAGGVPGGGSSVQEGMHACMGARARVYSHVHVRSEVLV